MVTDEESSRLLSFLDTINEWIGRGIAWLTLLMVLVTFAVVVLRYAFDFGSIALQESVTYMHAAVFMLGAAYTLKHEGHVRVDIFYARMSPKGQALVDLFGTLLLLIPVSVFIFWTSWEYVLTSWGVKEGSREAGGLAYLYVLKSLMLVMPALLVVQGVVIVMRSFGRLATVRDNG